MRLSTRLTLSLGVLILGNVLGLSLVLQRALRDFFIQEAQTSLEEQAAYLAAQAGDQLGQEGITGLHSLITMLAVQENLQIRVFDPQGQLQLEGQGIPTAGQVPLPPHLIPATLTGSPMQGQFRTETTIQFPSWLYSTMPIQHDGESLGAVYVAMPLQRPQEFAQEVAYLVMGMTVVSVALATVVGLILSRSITVPLQQLHRQAQRLKSGDYTARSQLQGRDELAQLSRLLDAMSNQLVQAWSELQEQEQARRDLVANISHDLRTPLTTLRLGLEAVADGLVPEDQVPQHLERACREVDYISRLVQQMQTLSQVDAGQLPLHPQAVSLVAIAQECLSRMEPLASQAQIQLDLQAAPELPPVWVDAELTGQALLNLLDNAIKYAPQSEVIRISIDPPTWHEQQQWIPLHIQDQGPGIPPDQVERVTERFYRGDTARPRGGMGLGLAIAQHVCYLQGGSLQIQSQVGEGTRITLQLPVVVAGA